MSSTGIEQEKRVAAEAAAGLVTDGMTVGLGTGTTVSYLLPALAARGLRIRCVATSPATATAALGLGLEVQDFRGITSLDLAIDGADQIDAAGWVVKGGGGAHTREKVVASAADRFVVIASSDKLVERVHPPVPLEILAFGADSTLHALPGATLRPGAALTPDGGLLADWHDPFDDPAALAALLSGVAGVVEHGLFAPSLVSEVIVGTADGLDRRP